MNNFESDYLNLVKENKELKEKLEIAEGINAWMTGYALKQSSENYKNKEMYEISLVFLIWLGELYYKTSSEETASIKEEKCKKFKESDFYKNSLKNLTRRNYGK